MPNKERAGTVTAIVDLERCTGRGACEGVYPEAFELPDDAAEVKPDETVAKLLRGTRND